MKTKLTNHSKNLDIYKMGHRITSDEMVREHWLPLLTERAKEDWLKNPIRESPLWPKFEEFLEAQAEACRERERLGLVTIQSETSHMAQINQPDEDRLRQRSYKKGRDRGIQRQRHHQQMAGDLHCSQCNDTHPNGSHTQSYTESRKRIFQAATSRGQSKQTQVPR